MQIKEIMRTEFLRINANDSLEDVLKKFIKWNVSSAPVFEENGFIGIISIATIVKFLNSRAKNFQIWKKATNRGKDEAIESVYTKPAYELVTRPRLVLKPTETLDGVVTKAVNANECIPVIEGNEFLGIIRNKDIVIYLLTEIALYHSRNSLSEMKSAKEQYLSSADSASITFTIADRIMEMIKVKSPIRAKEIAANLGISEAYVEKIADTLEKHRLAEIEYSLFKGMQLKRIEHDKG